MSMTPAPGAPSKLAGERRRERKGKRKKTRILATREVVRRAAGKRKPGLIIVTSRRRVWDFHSTYTLTLILRPGLPRVFSFGSAQGSCGCLARQSIFLGARQKEWNAARKLYRKRGRHGRFKKLLASSSVSYLLLSSPPPGSTPSPVHVSRGAPPPPPSPSLPLLPSHVLPPYRPIVTRQVRLRCCGDMRSSGLFGTSDTTCDTS